VGRGIAIPHPRNPVVSAEGEELRQFTAIAFPASPVDWASLDGKPVHTVFLTVSASPKQHLSTLSKINFLCQQEAFYGLLQNQAPAEEIISAIREAESSWVKMTD
jgi:PTS system nitrogen regulatory IIA component